MTNKRVLVDALQATPSIAGRYSNAICVNIRAGTSNEKRGSYSLVFRAKDDVTGVPVAIKLMDPDWLHDPYRLDCFKREPTILSGLQGYKRCLRLVEGHKIFDVELPMAGGVFKFPIGFFVTEWLEKDIDDYFVNQSTYAALVRLEVFRQIVLAVKALHDHEVHHRDLKRDNLRLRIENDQNVVVAIDLGAAAAASSAHLKSDYGMPVGHQGYAPPEAFVGLAGMRQLGRLTDAYSLGAMLYELFMPGFFFAETLDNPVFASTLVAAIHKAAPEPDLEKRLTLWKQLVRQFARAVQPPSILGPGSSVPVAVSTMVADLYSRLAAFDLNVRLSDLDFVFHRIDSCIKCLKSDKLQQLLVAERKKRRAERLARAQAKEARVRARAALMASTSK